jgi:hypothetical protein
MSFQRSIATGALTLAVVMSLATPAGAQFGRGGNNQYTPDPGARDLKAVLFNWAWHMGMLRGEGEFELIQTFEYRAEGTVQVDGEPCELATYEPAEPGVLGTAGYRISVNYQIPGYRVQIRCTLPNGETYSNVETMSGVYAWDEDIPGAEIVPGEGEAMPNPGAFDERWIRLWASPHGAVKAAIAAAAGVPVSEAYGKSPAALLDAQAGAGVEPMTTLEWRGDEPILTFPIPGLPGAVATAMLNDEFLPESIVVEYGNDTTEFVYRDFQDFNNPFHKIEALIPSQIIERQNGEVVRNLETVITEVGNVYVVVPVPDSVRAARN